MQTVKQDITTMSRGFILHQVNCKGVMGSGLARQIADKWPKVLDDYRSLVERAPLGSLLGSSQTISISPDLYVVNLFGQEGFGRDKVHTDYAALARAMANFRLGAGRAGLLFATEIFVPFKIGCGLGGGDWNRVLHIIEGIIPEATICEPPQGERHDSPRPVEFYSDEMDDG